MRNLISSQWMRRGLSLSLILILLVLAPFAVAQDVHHELAAADTDGHEHSDMDLCQWVQHHTAGTIDLGGPAYSAFDIVSTYATSGTSSLPSVVLFVVSPSCAPPSTFTYSTIRHTV